MEISTASQEKVSEAIANGNVNMKDMTAIIKACIMDLVPVELQGLVSVEANTELLDYYMAVEKSINPIPWINTEKVLFLEMPPKVLTSPKAVNKERIKLRKGGFPEGEFAEVMSACHSQVEAHRVRAKAVGEVYKQTEPIVFCYLPEEEANRGVLVTEIDGQYSKIYSNCTCMPFNKSQRLQNLYVKTIVERLLREMPLGPHTRRIQYAFLIEEPRIAFFARL